MNDSSSRVCRVVRNGRPFAIPASGTAVSVGSFDGLHVGHQHLISSAVSSGLPVAVISFYPHPAAALGRIEQERRSLSTFRQKRQGLERLGVRYFAPVLFSSLFREYSAEQFVRRYLVEYLGAKTVVLGEDACFGKGRELRIAGIENLLSRFGVECRVVKFFELGDGRVSSQRVRSAVTSGQLSEARSLLGRAYAIEGRVVPGDRRGSEIGIPTANLYTPHQLLPPDGVYATRTRLRERDWLSITNIGVRPTFSGGALRVETHLLDLMNEPLYREHIEVSFLGSVRPERAFRGVGELKAQIEKDIEWVRKHYA